MTWRTAIGLWVLVVCGAGAEEPALRRSDVVFMYGADAATYEAYGATVLAWGGKPTAASRAAAKGVKVFGSVGMVTEFGRYHDRFPETYEEGLCRDAEGKPVKVPWLTDHQHKGIPYWWCCTRQPVFQQYLRERVEETIRAGADGLHIDDHLGTAGGLWLGLCFCDRCVGAFGAYVRSLPEGERRRLGVATPTPFDYRAVVRAWVAAAPEGERKPAQHPLWEFWSAWQCRSAAAFMDELHALADRTAGRRVPMGANAGLLWPRHLADYRALDLFSAETDHHAAGERFSDAPLFAYRLADAVGRPYAATASGGDWAFIKERNRPGMVCGWIALGYAAGHCLMAPHRQWCYTPEKGTHWYAGPQEVYAPLYRFVRREAAHLDGFENHADVEVVLPHRSFLRDPGLWFGVNEQLAAANVSYRVRLAGDETVDRRLTAGELAGSTPLLVMDREALDPEDRRILEAETGGRLVFGTVKAMLAGVRPAVRVNAPAPLRVLPRVKDDLVVIHLLNYDYDAGADKVRPVRGVRLELDVRALGMGRNAKGRLAGPGLADRPEVVMEDGAMELPELGLWTLVVLPRGG